MRLRRLPPGLARHPAGVYSRASMGSPYQALGGRAGVLELVRRFYDIMEEREPELAKLHELDACGKVSAHNRDRFGLFLVGWLGGPDDYIQQHGHPRLRMRHMHVQVDTAMRDAWLRCMDAALDERRLPPDVDTFLRQRFAEVAAFLRNVDH